MDNQNGGDKLNVMGRLREMIKSRYHPIKLVLLGAIAICIAAIVVLARSRQEAYVPVPTAYWNMIEQMRPSQETLDQLKQYLDCPSRHFPPSQNAGALREAYAAALKKGAEQGFTPILVQVDDNFFAYLLASLQLETLDMEAVRAARQKLLAQPLPDGLQWLNDRQAELESMGISLEEDASVEGYLPSGAGAEDMWSDLQPYDILLAEIPTDQPWQVFAWLPMGGWNECPDASAMMGVSRYWYETYQAVPKQVSQDTLIYGLPKGLGKEASLQAARQHMAFCFEAIDYGLGPLAGDLRRAKEWMFWWD